MQTMVKVYYGKVKQPSSKYVGVSWDKSRDSWLSSISIGGKRKILGCFGTELEAARRWNIEAKLLGRSINLLPL
jgi:hypothetical protein